MTVIETQTQYFQILQRHFGSYYRRWKKSGVDSMSFAQTLAENGDEVAKILRAGERAGGEIASLWGKSPILSDTLLGTQDHLSLLYGREFYPDAIQAHVCATGLYVDTFVIADQIEALAVLQREFAGPFLASGYIAVAMEQLNLKELALADVTPPIVLIIPDVHGPQRSLPDELINRDLLGFASDLFEQPFTTVDLLGQFLQGKRSIEAMVASFKKPSKFVTSPIRMPSATDYLTHQIAARFRETGGDYPQLHPGGVVFEFLRRMSLIVNEAMLQSASVGATPFIDDETSWHHLVWKYELEGRASSANAETAAQPSLIKAMDILHEDGFNAVTNVAPKALIELRRKGALHELRSSLFGAIQKVDVADPNAQSQVAADVAHNLDELFAEHRCQLDDFHRLKRKFFGYEITPFLGVVTLNVLALCVQSPYVEAAKKAVDLWGATKGKEVYVAGTAYWSKRKELAHLPTSILIRHQRRP